MAQLRGFLDRFRPAGAPGAARAGVPADRAREQDAELQPVLAPLDSVQAECAGIVESARREADRIAAAAQAEVAAIEGEAQLRARAAREEAAQELLEQASEQAREATATAGREAVQIRHMARQRLPDLVAAAVGLVRAGPAGPGHGGAVPGAGTGHLP